MKMVWNMLYAGIIYRISVKEDIWRLQRTEEPHIVANYTKKDLSAIRTQMMKVSVSFENHFSENTFNGRS